MAIGIDFISGYRGWSVDYVLPIGILVVDGIVLGCMFFNRRSWHSYMMWQIFMILCSFIPVGLYLAELERNPVMAFLPLAASAAIFLGTVIIGDRRARKELLRRFHIETKNPGGRLSRRGFLLQRLRGWKKCDKIESRSANKRRDGNCHGEKE